MSAKDEADIKRQQQELDLFKIQVNDVLNKLATKFEQGLAAAVERIERLEGKPTHGKAQERKTHRS